MTVVPSGARHRADAGLTCAHCLHFIDSARDLERMWSGLTIVSSAAGSSRGACGVCALDEVFLAPEPACGRFELREASSPDGR